MILSDGEIRQAIYHNEITISPFDLDKVRTASYDLRLDNKLFKFNQSGFIDPRSNVPHGFMIDFIGGYYLQPGEFILGSTKEKITFGDSIVGVLNGKSSLGRLGIQIHATAGFFDPGFSGEATLEISNICPLSVLLYPDMVIAQMVFMRTGQSVERPYWDKTLNSKYYNQTGPTPSKYFLNGVQDEAS